MSNIINLITSILVKNNKNYLDLLKIDRIIQKIDNSNDICIICMDTIELRLTGFVGCIIMKVG